jgi:MFS transporter, PPP family, 3-phenylpropionic acid transporter
MLPKDTSKYFFIFILLYAFSYACNAAYSIYMPVYLNSVGYSKTNIGVLLSLAPVVAIMGQPIWGTLSDRSSSKNRILITLIVGSTFSILFYRLSINFFYLSFIITLFTFFQTSINSMSDAIALEYTSDTRIKFGHIRLSGTIGYSIMSVLAGTLLMTNISRMFTLYFVAGLLTLCVALFLPKVKGHQSKGKRLQFWSLLNNRQLLLYMAFALIIQTTLGYYYTFFSIYFQQLGATKSLVGWGNFVSAMSELPFLLFAHILLKKFKTSHALTLAGSAAALRWLLLGTVVNTNIILLMQILHGMSNIVVTFSLATYINKTVPKELKASGQAISGLVCAGISRVIGSLLGGYLSDAFGIKNMFIYNSILVFAAVIVFNLELWRKTTTPKEMRI